MLNYRPFAGEILYLQEHGFVFFANNGMFVRILRGRANKGNTLFGFQIDFVPSNRSRDGTVQEIMNHAKIKPLTQTARTKVISWWKKDAKNFCWENIISDCLTVAAGRTTLDYGKPFSLFFDGYENFIEKRDWE